MRNKLPTTSAGDLSEKMNCVIRNEIFFEPAMNFKTKQVCVHNLLTYVHKTLRKSTTYFENFYSLRRKIS